MFVVTADQRASRTHEDLVPGALAALEPIVRGRVALPPERTTGDELQFATEDADAVMDVCLRLTREGAWSIGVGVGSIESPLPHETRAGRGAAFIHARDAVERAKSAPGRLAVTSGDPEAAGDVEALIQLLIDLRDRRSVQGWELADLLADAMTQRQAAVRLGITESAVSRRAGAAGLRTEEAAIPALARALRRLDGGA
ncbi:MAG TPA: DNA-binding protein [Microbacterium sp.]|uniref:DNA-binding protein n=1 Tax=Microbacterium sp. TaxID=51671 RepID=UPI002CB84528|nr:DNA-binding protein [Microbacterium sp.]HWI32116.1 DNA-binding protein [Microbacterium sp.]